MVKIQLFDVFGLFFNFRVDFKTIFIIPKTVNTMDFTLSEDLRMLKELAREFTNSEIKPVAQKIDEEEKIPKELIQKLAEVGFFGTSFPKNMVVVVLEKSVIVL